MRAADHERQAARQRVIDTKRLEEERLRRELIQEAKRTVIERWAYASFIGVTLKAEMLLEIERALSTLPADDLPLDELVQIAAGVRDRLHDEARQAEQDAQRRRLEQNRRRRELIEHGMDYAKRELGGVEGLDGLTRWSIEQRVARALDGIGGDESLDEIEDLVEDVLEREGVGLDENDDGSDDDE